MQNMKEALHVRAELVLWCGRKAVHQPRLESLRSKYILEQDNVNRLQRGIFSKLKEDYEEKLEKEKKGSGIGKGRTGSHDRIDEDCGSKAAPSGIAGQDVSGFLGNSGDIYFEWG